MWNLKKIRKGFQSRRLQSSTESNLPADIIAKTIADTDDFFGTTLVFDVVYRKFSCLIMGVPDALYLKALFELSENPSLGKLFLEHRAHVKSRVPQEKNADMNCNTLKKQVEELLDNGVSLTKDELLKPAVAGAIKSGWSMG